MSDLSRVNVVLIVFAMPGCPACEDHLPRFKRQVDGFRRFGHPFAYHQEGAVIAPRSIPIVIYDATSEDAGVQALADQHGITGMPTTVLLVRGRRPEKFEGSQEDAEIYNLLVTATQANR